MSVASNGSTRLHALAAATVLALSAVSAHAVVGHTLRNHSCGCVDDISQTGIEIRA